MHLAMSNCVPANPKIFHIVHLDKLPSIISEGCLWCDMEVHDRKLGGTAIGMSHIKQKRMTNYLSSYPELTVGQCVPFYFCPRSVMLYIIKQQNHKDMIYKDGQQSIIHLQADLRKTVEWANKNIKRWVFTNSNAGSSYFIDFNDLFHLNQINWNSVREQSWKNCREQKQAEFLLEKQFPWTLIEAIGVFSLTQYKQINHILSSAPHRPLLSIQPKWYY